jgi:type I restriction enzyme S subunit
MNAERLLALYERVAEAPDAITRLRRFILDLAVRGKLVPQDASEEPSKGFKKLSDPATPFELPNNWKWIEIGDQLELLNGMAFKPTDWIKDGLRIVRIQNLNNPTAPFNFCNPEMARERSLIDNGSFLISWSGTPGTSFGAFIWDRGSAVLNQHIFRCDYKTKAFFPAFLRLAINGRLDEMIAKAHGGVGLQHITKGKLEALLIPLPPLAEQHRIVAKVDEFMALCDQLKAARQEREARRDRLAAASLARLNAPDPETFQSDARFTLNALPALTTRPNQIKQLRQTILNLAVRGKLVPQDPNDEPASELLKRIAKERTDLVRRKEIRREDALAPIQPGEMPFGVVPSWTWARIGDVVLFTQYGTSQKSNPSDHGIPVLTMGNIQDGLVVSNNEKRIPDTSEELPALYLRKFDLLYNRTNSAELVGKTGIYLDENDTTTFASYLIRLRPSITSSNPQFLNTAMNTTQFRETQILPLIKKQTGQANVNGTALKNMLIPLPPLAEQHGIVAKVDELMTLCDRLEASLTTSDQTRTRLLEATLTEALAPASASEMEAVE